MGLCNSYRSVYALTKVLFFLELYVELLTVHLRYFKAESFFHSHHKRLLDDAKDHDSGGNSKDFHAITLELGRFEVSFCMVNNATLACHTCLSLNLYNFTCRQE